MRLSSRPDVLRLEAKRDVGGLVQALGYRADPKIQQAASNALTVIGEPAIPALVQAIASPTLQNPAMAVLRNIGTLSIEPLINVIKIDQREDLRKSAVKVLADIGMFAIEPLVSTLTHTDPEVRSAAVDGLLLIGALSVEPLIIQLNNSNHPNYVHFDVIKALMKLGGSQATSALLNTAQNDPSAEVRKCAADALGHQIPRAEPTAPPPKPTPPTRPRGLSQRFKVQETKRGDKGAASRWPELHQTLPQLQPISIDGFQRLMRTHAIQRQFPQPIDLINDLDKEYSQYSRIKESDYANVSIKLVFDNEVKQGDQVIPATRQLEATIVFQNSQYFLFVNATYIKHYW